MPKLLYSLLAAWCGLGAMQSAQESRVRMMFSQHRYVQPAYMREPPIGTSHIFFQGDPIELAALFVNASDAIALFPVQVVSPSESVEADLIGGDGRTRTKVAFDLLEEPYLEDASGRMAAQWTQPISMGPRVSLYVPLRLRAPIREPGVYSIRLSRLRLVCEAPCSVVNHGGEFTFEVRPLDQLPERLDRFARLAIRAVDDEQPENAEKYLQRLLAKYPDGSIAFQIRGRLAERQGRWLDAALSYDTAAQLVDSGRDRLRIEKDGGTAVSGSLRSLAARARQRGAKK